MKRPRKPVLAIVVPCYNEEEALPETAKRLSEKIAALVSGRRISPKSTLLFVDDGSGDNTWALIEEFHAANPLVFNGVKLSANRGHQNALFCGLLSVKDCADAAISIDADLQDDIDAIDRMLESYLSGAEIVFGVRSGRESDGCFKRISARFFYRLMRLLGARLVDNHADFRLMGREAMNALAERGEANLFLRGAIPLLGYKQELVYYDRKKRQAGKSKYTLARMLAFALDGIFSAGVLGKHMGKIYGRVKRRPAYRVEKTLFAPEPVNENG